METDSPIEKTKPSLSAQTFYAKYVSKRKPVVITGLPDDASFKAQRWTDLAYLASKAGDAAVLVEPIHPVANQFGTDVERVSVKFSEFLETLKSEEGPHPYLTTQYAEQDADAQTVLPPPTNALADDFPHVPRIMGNLFLQQVNLWAGRSKNGSTSGLHHDFHDNLYCLLQGRKRFVLYPPSELKNLYPHGKLDSLHENGLISYVENPVRSDGLPVRVALKARVKALEQELEKLGSVPKGKGKTKQASKERQRLMEAHDEALDELAQFTLEGGDGLEMDDEVDDFDALMAGLGDGEGDLGDLGEDAGEGEDEDESEDEEFEEWNGFIQMDEEEADEKGEEENDEPPSFSRIPTALVHQHLGLASTAVPPEGKSLDDFPNLGKTTKPYIVDLSAGEMLYLPASWWHEVTSTSGTGEEAVHMAFNYWFYPPDRLDRFEEPYEDHLVWDYFRSRAEGSETDPAKGKKRKLDENSAHIKKKARR